MLNPSEFGSNATITLGSASPVAIQGMYIDDYFEILNGTSTGVESTQPAFLARDIDTTGVRHGDTVLIGSVTYTIVGVKPHGVTGLVALQLETP